MKRSGLRHTSDYESSYCSTLTSGVLGNIKRSLLLYRPGIAPVKFHPLDFTVSDGCMLVHFSSIMMSQRKHHKQVREDEYDYSSFDDNQPEPKQQPTSSRMITRSQSKRIQSFQPPPQETLQEIPRPSSRGSSSGHSSRGCTPTKHSQNGVTAPPRPSSRGSTASADSFTSYTANRGRPTRDEVEQALFPEEEETIVEGCLPKRAIYQVLDRFTAIQLTQMCMHVHVCPPSQKKNDVLRTAVYLIHTKDELVDFILSIFL